MIVACPFCGASASAIVLIDSGAGMQARCDACGARGPQIHGHVGSQPHNAEAMYRWNQRTEGACQQQA